MEYLLIALALTGLVLGRILWRRGKQPDEEPGPQTDGVRTAVARALETRKKD